MTFLKKLDWLMERDNLNKSTLSKASGIPYTTIDGWYKKGYEGLKLNTLLKLAKFFDTSLDFWVNNKLFDDIGIDNEAKKIAKQYIMLSNSDRKIIKNMINSLLEKNSHQKQNNIDIDESDEPEEIEVFRAAKSESNNSPEVIRVNKDLIRKLKTAPRVTKEEDL